MKPIGEQSLYEILEVARDAPPEVVEEAYARAKALYGPGSLAVYSLVAPEEMALLNRRIEEARRVLLDPRSRAGYDAALPDAPGRPRSEAPPPEVEAGAGPGGGEPAPSSQPGGGPPEGGSSATPAVPSEAPAPASAAPGAAPGPSAAARPGFAVPDGTPWTGELLRKAREARGVTLHLIADRTKVARHHLENIEADRYDLLPAPVYLRGILVSLAKELRLDGQKVARSYLQQAQEALAGKPPPQEE